MLKLSHVKDSLENFFSPGRVESDLKKVFEVEDSDQELGVVKFVDRLEYLDRETIFKIPNEHNSEECENVVFNFTKTNKLIRTLKFVAVFRSIHDSIVILDLKLDLEESYDVFFRIKYSLDLELDECSLYEYELMFSRFQIA